MARTHPTSRDGTGEKVPEEHVVSDTVAGIENEGDEIHVVTGSSRDVPEPVQDVVEIERSVGATTSEVDRAEGVRAVSFSRDGQPVPIDMNAVPELVTHDENFVWIDLTRAPDALNWLARELHFSHREVHAALSEWQRPALDVAGDHFSVSVTLPRFDAKDRHVVAGRLFMFVGRNYLVSTHLDALPFDDSILARVRLNPELPRLDAAFMLYIILDSLLEYFEDQGDDADEEIERMELLALVDAHDDFLGELLRVKRYVYALSRLVEQHRQVFVAFLRPDFPFVTGDDISGYFRDLDGRLNRLLDNLASAKESVNGSFDIYVSRVAHQTNAVMKVLTIVSAVLLPITVILSFFSTSFSDLGPVYSTQGFVIMIALIVLSVTGLIAIFKFRGWF
jgi:magnesium transporter